MSQITIKINAVRKTSSARCRRRVVWYVLREREKSSPQAARERGGREREGRGRTRGSIGRDLIIASYVRCEIAWKSLAPGPLQPSLYNTSRGAAAAARTAAQI